MTQGNLKFDLNTFHFEFDLPVKYFDRSNRHNILLYTKVCANLTYCSVFICNDFILSEFINIAIDKYFSQLLLVFLFLYDAYNIFGERDGNFEDYNNN